MDGQPGRDSYVTGPGLVVEVLDASVAAGIATATVKITDGDGVPLDRDGHYTVGRVSLSFTIARLELDGDGDPGQYIAYPTRIQTAPSGDSAEQAASENSGTFVELGIAEGTYLYTFVTPVDPADPTLTHTVGVWGTRTFDEVRYASDAVFDFVPDGTDVVAERNVIDDATCASCHDALSAHGGARKKVELCVLCHTQQTTDPDTGNTVDMRVMIHKIHRGEELPSVQGGTPYQIVGNNQSVHDYSTVAFPQPVGNCATCHAATLADNWKTKPSLAACISCHDNIAFQTPVPAGMVLHGGGVQPPDAPCNVCHAAETSIAPIVQSHLVPEYDPLRPEPVITIVSVTNTAPGMQPTITFRVTVLGTPRDIIAAPLGSLRATFAGPNTDYTGFWQSTIQGSGAAGTLVAVDAPNGVFAWTAPASAAIPPTATGSYTVGMEGNYTPPGGVRQVAVGVVMPFAVTDATAVARRTVVDRDLCNSCHGELAEHGGSRKNPQYCALCHNPMKTNNERVSRLEGADVLVPSVDLKLMVHRIHMGEELSQAYFLFGFPAPSTSNPVGTPIDFGETRYPSRRQNCASCHVASSYEIPLPLTRVESRDEIRTCIEDPAADPDSLCSTANFVVQQTIAMQPEAAACLGCHDSTSTVAHTIVMTTMTGLESCATCHGPGSGLDVAVVHGLE